eukprot:3953609-Prymnesium_polylepis.1
MAPAGSSRIVEHRDRSQGAQSPVDLKHRSRCLRVFGASPHPPPRSWAARDSAKHAHARKDGSPGMIAHLGRAETRVGGARREVARVACASSHLRAARLVGRGGCPARA